MSQLRGLIRRLGARVPPASTHVITQDLLPKDLTPRHSVSFATALASSAALEAIAQFAKRFGYELHRVEDTAHRVVLRDVDWAYWFPISVVDDANVGSTIEVGVINAVVVFVPAAERRLEKFVRSVQEVVPPVP